MITIPSFKNIEDPSVGFRRNPPEIMTLEEAAEYLQISSKTLRRLMEEDSQIPYKKLGERCYRFSRKSLEGWVQN